MRTPTTVIWPNTEAGSVIRKSICAVIALFLCVRLSAQQAEIEKLQKSLPLVTDSIIYTNLLNRISTLYYLKNADSCYYYAHKAYLLAEKYNLRRGLADALNNIGIFYSIKTNTYLATRYYNESLELYKRLQDTANQAQLVMNIGLELCFNNKVDEGLKYFREAYNLSTKTSYDSIRSLVISNMISFDSSLSYDSVKALLAEGRAVAAKYNDIRMLVGFEENYASVLMRMGKYEEAIKVLEKAAPEALRLGLEYELIIFYNKLGSVWINKDSAQAIYYYQLALQTAEKERYSDVYVVSAERLYQLYKAKKDPQNAGIYAEILVNAASEYQRFVQESGVDYLNYILTGKQLILEKEKNKDRQFYNILMSVFVGVIFILLFIIYRAYQSSKKYSASLKELNNMIYKKNKQLEQNSEFKDKLISLLAHDFRQPLISLSSLVSLLKQHETLTQEEMDKVLESIEHSSQSSVDIFENILQWIKKQLSGFVYKPEELYMHTLVNEAAEVFEIALKEKALTLINKIDDDACIYADREMIQFVNRNLIHNAIKFSPHGGEIHITCISTEKETIIAVKDFGKGMSKEKLNNLFNFFTVKSFGNNAEKGAGVALVICKDFIDKMNGRLWAESEQGNGSVFCFALPLTPRHKKITEQAA
ncbi:ATP-binding protein [Foetidibacter luteolus]|uniref:ATP-binding protein n=1 Tax=Foetidibacter luteolus TaxID=2608880 RepID=UPI00129B2B1B|nr:tetratricopeptide repeat-containing sensor histidine kinase [Foetidibacter luteolus]